VFFAPLTLLLRLLGLPGRDPAREPGLLPALLPGRDPGLLPGAREPVPNIAVVFNDCPNGTEVSRNGFMEISAPLPPRVTSFMGDVDRPSLVS